MNCLAWTTVVAGKEWGKCACGALNVSICQAGSRALSENPYKSHQSIPNLLCTRGPSTWADLGWCRRIWSRFTAVICWFVFLSWRFSSSTLHYEKTLVLVSISAPKITNLLIKRNLIPINFWNWVTGVWANYTDNWEELNSPFPDFLNDCRVVCALKLRMEAWLWGKSKNNA